MNKAPTRDDRPTTGLRERKKAKTRAAIQQHALRLFQQQGYDATTVEQIAEAAEISPSTFFRYFPTKEDVVLYDDVDPLLFAAFEAQSAQLSPVQAMRGAIRSVFHRLTGTDMVNQFERGRLILEVPELRMRMLDQLADAVDVTARLVAKRVGRPADDLAVRTYAGAMIGAIMSALLTAIRDPKSDIFAAMDAALEYLEAGLPL